MGPLAFFAEFLDVVRRDFFDSDDARCLESQVFGVTIRTVGSCGLVLRD